MREDKTFGADAAAVDTARSAEAADSASHVAHTKGPWRVDEEDPFVVLSAENVTAECGISILPPKEKLANAHLIAAAPDLLAACQALMQTHHGYHLGAGPCICHAHEAARLAIAKAEGR